MAVNQGSSETGVIAKCPSRFVADDQSWRIIEWRIIEGLLYYKERPLFPRCHTKIQPLPRSLKNETMSFFCDLSSTSRIISRNFLSRRAREHGLSTEPIKSNHFQRLEFFTSTPNVNLAAIFIHGINEKKVFIWVIFRSNECIAGFFCI